MTGEPGATGSLVGRGAGAGAQGIVLRLRAAGCVFAEAEAELLIAEGRPADELEALVSRRVAGEPLEYVLGWAEFHGLRVAVAPGVFVPRHRSDLLVDLAVAATAPGSLVLDLCCGTGALGLAVARAVPSTELVAADLDPASVAVARTNLAGIGTVYEGDLFAALPAGLRGRIDTIVVNAPYVPTAEIALMPPEAREHEAVVTLDGGADGLELHRRIATDAPAWLASGGRLLIELGSGQASASAEAFEAAGLATRIESDDDATVVIATAPERPPRTDRQ